MTDDRGVDEHVQRLGGQRPERGQGQPQDLPVVARTPHGLSVGWRSTVKLRLYHHADGARIAYREAGTGPPLVLLHSAGLSHREFEPLVEELADRFRLVLPDLPLHGDSEDRPRHPYAPEWIEEVLSGFIREAAGARPCVGGHDSGAQLILRCVARRRIRPSHLVLMPSPLHRRPGHERAARIVRATARVGGVPGGGALAARAATLAFRPAKGEQ